MDFKTFFEVAPAVLEARFPVMVRGRHGIGKSQVIYAMVEKLGFNPETNQVRFFDNGKIPEGWVAYGMVERRASQMTEGELTGLPSTDSGVTRWNAPDWFRACCDNPMVLFMDEIDRGVLEVRQGFFELTDSRKIYGNELHPGTVIFAACNGGEQSGQYQVSELDPAEADRWEIYDLDPTTTDWLVWAKDRVHPVIWDFVNQNEFHLENTKGDFEPNRVYPSRRSWDRLSQTISRYLEDCQVNCGRIFNITQGFVGREAAFALRDFCEKYDKQVTISDLLDHGKFDLLKTWKNPEHASMILKIRESKTLESILTETQISNLQKYFKLLPGELAMTLFHDVMNSFKDIEGDPMPYMQQVAQFHHGIKDEVLRLVNDDVQAATIGGTEEEAKTEET
jgi:hypothetical protein